MSTEAISTYKDVITLNEETIEAVFQYINRTTNFDHVIYKGQPYYERENQWQNSECPIRPDYDPDLECDNYMSDCEAPDDDIYPSDDEDIEFVINREPDVVPDEDYWTASELDLYQRLQNKDLEKVLLVGYEKLIIHNTMGINEDHRGSDHCKVHIPFNSQTIDTKSLTLRELMTRFYQLKSHHWDKNYEMFCGTKTIIRGGTIKVYLNFDHGS
jgi:hypothetical protein